MYRGRERESEGPDACKHPQGGVCRKWCRDEREVVTQNNWIFSVSHLQLILQKDQLPMKNSSRQKHRRHCTLQPYKYVNRLWRLRGDRIKKKTLKSRAALITPAEAGEKGFNSCWVSTEQWTHTKPHQPWLNKYGLWQGTHKQELILRKTHMQC